MQTKADLIFIYILHGFYWLSGKTSI